MNFKQIALLNELQRKMDAFETAPTPLNPEVLSDRITQLEQALNLALKRIEELERRPRPRGRPRKVNAG